MSTDKLRQVATAVLIDHIGVAAGFVVNKAIANVEKNHTAQSSQAYLETYFFFELNKLLPPEVPAGKVQASILARLNA